MNKISKLTNHAQKWSDIWSLEMLKQLLSSFETKLDKWIPPPGEIDNEPAYADADAFKCGLTPHPEGNFEWVAAYAKARFEYLLAIQRDLDAKADAIVRYLGSGAGIGTIGLLATLPKLSGWVLLGTMPAFGFAVIAIVLASRARMPAPNKLPPEVDVAITYVQEFGDDAQARFLGQWHMVNVGLFLAIEKKAQIVMRAAQNFAISLACLPLPLLVAGFISLIHQFSGAGLCSSASQSP